MWKGQKEAARNSKFMAASLHGASGLLRWNFLTSVEAWSRLAAGFQESPAAPYLFQWTLYWSWHRNRRPSRIFLTVYSSLPLTWTGLVVEVWRHPGRAMG